MLYLASTSPRRSALLAEHGVPFTTIPNLLETESVTGSTLTQVRASTRNLAYQKATRSAANYQGWILGCDTVIYFDTQILGKPKNLADAKKILTQLSGKSHFVITGIALFNSQTKESVTRSGLTKIHFNRLTPAIIDHYLSQVTVLDKAGAYALQEHGELLIKKILGSYTNVIGLPMEIVLTLLKKYDIV